MRTLYTLPSELPNAINEDAALDKLQLIYKYPNEYGASVIQFRSGSLSHLFSGWKLAVLHDNYLCYNSGITDDVITNLTGEEVQDYLNQIAELPPAVHDHVHDHYVLR